MSFLYMLLFVLSTTTFSQALHYGQKRGTHVPTAIAVNYIIAALATAMLWQVKGVGTGGQAVWSVAIAGVVAGAMFCFHLPFVLGAYRAAGVGITSTVIRVGVVIPALVAWYVWGENMTTMRWLALALVPFAMILLRKHDRTSRLTPRTDVFLLGSLFVGAGILTTHKYVEVHFSSAQQEIYKIFLFTTAAAIALTYVLLKQLAWTKRDVAIGLVLGLANTVALLAVMLGLETTSAVIFYPTTACAGITLNMLFARLLWKEKPLPIQMAGVLMTLLIVVLTNL